MDVITYALLKRYVDNKIANIPAPDANYLHHKGAVDTMENLINMNPSFGDVYTVRDEDKNYYYNGLRWMPIDGFETPIADEKSITKRNNSFSLVGFLEAKDGSYLAKGPNDTVVWKLPITEEKVQEIIQSSEVNIQQVVQNDFDELIFDGGKSKK